MNATQSKFNWPLAATVIALAVLIVGAFVGTRVMDFFQPKIIVNERTVVSTAISELKKKAKLVVLTAKVSALVEEENEEILEIAGFTIPRGKTKVILRSTSNRVQFVVPLDALAKDNVIYDASLNELTVLLPHPVADPELVEIDPLPEVRTDVGWLRMDARSGEHLRNKAKSRVREFVLREAANPVYCGAARDAGREAAMTLLAPTIARIPGNVHLRIEFGEPPKQPEG